MGFWLQLKMILWKNFVTRKRQKVRCATELIWPLFLFLILMWVRTRGLRTNVTACYLTEKAMPSTGILPFIQSFVCTFNNTCHPDVNSSNVHSGDINFNTLMQLIIDLEKIFKDDVSSETKRSISTTVSDIQDLVQYVQNISSTDDTSAGKVKVKDFIIDSEELYKDIAKNNILLKRNIYDDLLDSELSLNEFTADEFLILAQSPRTFLCTENNSQRKKLFSKNISTEICAFSDENMKDFRNSVRKQLNLRGLWKEFSGLPRNRLNDSLSTVESQQLTELYKRLGSSFLTMQKNLNFELQSSERANTNFDIMESLNDKSNSSKVKEAIILIQKFLCGNQSSDILSSILRSNIQANRFDSLQDQLKDRTRVRYTPDNDTTPECNNIFSKIEENPGLQVIWRMMKPFIRGKILYTPVTPVTKRIMGRINASFAHMDEFLSMNSMILKSDITSEEEMLLNATETLDQIMEFTDSDRGKQFLNNSMPKNPNLEEILLKTKNAVESFSNTVDIDEVTESVTPEKNLQMNFTDLMKCIEFNKVEGLPKDEAEKEAMRLIGENKLWALLEFEDPGSEKLVSLITYKIRMNTERVDNTEAIQDVMYRASGRVRPFVDLKYITFGFAYLQDMVDHSIITEQTNRTDIPGILLQQFPYPCYIDDQFVMAISRTFPLFMVLSWVYTCSMIVKSIVYEKEQRLKETMRVMGLGNGIHWIGWFIDSLVPMVFTILILTIILVAGKVLMRADGTIVYVFLLVYCLATIAQSFLISVFFSRANLSAACAGIIFFILYLPYPFMVRWMIYLSSVHKTLLCLFSNVAFGLGASYLSLYEEQGTGLSWNNVGSSPLYGDSFNLAYIMLMLVVDTLLYLILTWYIEAVFPGQYGIPKKWYFPFTLLYWTRKQKTFDALADTDINKEYLDAIEPEPVGLKRGVEISHLSKVYSNGKVAVNDISLNFYEGQITSFLGHNGAGKTTTISILMGLFPPSKGTAKIYGRDIRTDMDMIRKSLGMCPQHNVLFNWLTVEEHLWFYGNLRGGGERTKEFIESEAEQMLNDLGIPHKRKSMATELSGGMQRKLSIAVAFIGGSKTVILDEPTSGVDPYSRRSIWELLIKYKEGRTVILTTHYMDEADLLSNRIAIIANGKVQCCGSSIFLKSHFGSGYHLTLEMDSYMGNLKSNSKQDEPSEDDHTKELDMCIKTFIPSAIFLGRIGSEVMFVLPPRDDFSAFTNLCDYLDKNLSKLHVMSYGISDTSLEEIFLRVAEQNDPAMRESSNPSNEACFWTKIKNFFYFNQSKTKSKTSPIMSSTNGYPVEKEIVVHMNGSSVKYTSVPVPNNEPKEKIPNKRLRQFFALHTKRFHHSRRNRKAIFSELVLPALFVCMSLAVSSIFPKLQERPPLSLEPWIYPPPRYVLYSNDAPQDPYAQKYVNAIKGPQGIGSLCILVDGKRDKSCVDVSELKNKPVLFKNMTIVECSCKTGAQVCPANIGNPPPPSVKIASGDTLYDMTGQNISKWIINTRPRYKERRYGGYSFGVKLKVPNIDFWSMLGSLNPSNVPNMESIRFLSGATSKPAPNATNNIKVWFNNKGWVSSVAYMSAINNVVLREFLPSKDKADTYGIRTINHPMNFTTKQLDIELLKQSGFSLLHAISVIFALSFVPASFTMYLIEERVSNSKHLQLVSGVSRSIYWVQAFTWDMVCYIISSLLCVFIFLIFDEKAYVSETNLPGLLLLFLLYGWACIPLMYPMSFLFSVPSSAFVGLACANMFVGIITTVTTFVLGNFDDEELKAVDDIIKEVFLIFPHFCLGDGLMKLATNHLTMSSLQSLDIEYTNDIFEWDFLGKNFLCMFVLGIIFFIVTLSIEFKALRALFGRKLKFGTLPVNDEFDEEDVHNEKIRVAERNTAQDILVIDNLTKVYKRWGKSTLSVNHISVGVKPGECFGLLGLNGAGKTTTFKMLTGAISVTSGDASVKGHSIRTDINNVRALLGYCPQFDALDPLLTPREHLVLYGRIRNIPPIELQTRVDDGLRKFGLGHYSDRLAGTLSGGNKRKLSTAIALIGNPPLVFLDEPTSGMDPKARRFLWTCIQDVVRQGCSVILTSHSMEECQALCTRLTIMVNGKFKCMGTSQHLKNKYGGGYSITVRCKEENLKVAQEYITSNLTGSKLVEAHYNQLRYQIKDCRLSEVFLTLEKATNEDILLDYSLSQTTLEEVFIGFASEQIENKTIKKRSFPAVLKKCLLCKSGTVSSA